jgi:D-beta-D-heptose 7-phosphate kinase/D-beta-D-heptose 1-phosphate adenosyltransferase
MQFDLNQITNKNILVIGDVMLDTFYYGKVSRISPEAPVPVFNKISEKSVLGGAANVAANLIAANQNVAIMTIVGQDEAADTLINICKEQNINTDLIVKKNRKTTEKIRLLADNHQQVIRLDIEDTDWIDEITCQNLLDLFQSEIDQFELILISDYLKGLLSYDFTKGIIQLAGSNGIPVIVDVKDPKVEKYKDSYLLKPNRKELHELTGLPVSTDDEVIDASRKLKEVCACKYVLTTCGDRGMVLVGEDEPYFICSVGQEVFDVTGAGDTTIAYLAACIANGFSMREAVNIANYAAGIQVSKVGTSSVYWNEVITFLTNHEEKIVHKIISGKAIDNFRKKNNKKKIVFTNGCFDILHVGHVRYLQEASKLGDILIVGINSDDSVKTLKGDERPINSEQDRAEMLCALSFVDYVAIFGEATPYQLIKKIQPDVLVKGGDYDPEQVSGKDLVEERGGKLVLIPFVEGKSTTNIIKKIRS